MTKYGKKDGVKWLIRSEEEVTEVVTKEIMFDTVEEARKYADSVRERGGHTEMSALWPIVDDDGGHIPLKEKDDE